MFIAFEGIDGSGKTTLSKKVAEWLKNSGKSVIHSREPREPYRSIIFDPDTSDKEELLLFMADRARHIEKVIKPAINAGSIVITDRYILSSYAYQGFAKDNLDNCILIDTIQYWISEEFSYPDLVFVLTLDPEVALARATDKNKFEHKGLEYYKKLNEFYSNYTANNFPNTYLIDASQPLEKVFSDIISILKKYLKDKNEV